MRSRRFLAFVSVLLALSACTKSSSLLGLGPGPGGDAPLIPAREAYGMLLNDFAILVDVREVSELRKGMAAPARSMPMSAIDAGIASWEELVTKTPSSKQIIFYSSDTVRARKAARIAAAKGAKVLVLATFQEWVAARLPVKSP